MSDENLAQSGETDLFGHPIQPIRDRRGRPSFGVTKENQQFVMLRSAAGWTQENIAADMGIDPKTLRKNFSREMELGALMIEGQNLDVLSQKSREGNVSATKALDDMLARGQQRRADRRMRNPEGSKPTEKLGKKEEQRRAAEEAAEGEGAWGGLLTPGYTQ